MLMDCFDFCSILQQPHSSNVHPNGGGNPMGNHLSNNHIHRSGLMNTTGETTVSAGLPDPDSDEQQEVIEVQILPQVSQQHLSHTVALRDDFLIAICKKDEGWPLSKLDDSTRCLKITVKVSFNILSGTKVNWKCPKWSIWRVFGKNWSLRSNSVTRQVSFNWTKIGRKSQNSKIQMRHYE